MQTIETLDPVVPYQIADFIAAAEALGPLIDEHRTALASGPDIPVSIAHALEQAGLTRLGLPHDLGGPELPPSDIIRVIEAIARHDGAVAWCAVIASNGSRFAGMLPFETARELFGDHGFASGSISGSGTAVPDQDGWRLNGKWSFASFIRHSKLTGALCMEYENGVPRHSPLGDPVLSCFFVPTEKVKILYNWNGGGLRASGSHDFVLQDVWVPREHAIPFPVSVPHQPGALYRLPLMTALAFNLSAVPLGIARASIDALVNLAANKVPFGAQTKLREQVSAQADVAHAETLLRAARAFLFEAVDDFWATAVAGETPTLVQRAMARMAICNVAQASKQVVNLMYSAAGSSATEERFPFAAQLRDVYAATQHIAFSPHNMELAGRILLGLEPGTTRF
jgi:alkylation response protein AidB-like acyl-CoA dehydrogenase